MTEYNPENFEKSCKQVHHSASGCSQFICPSFLLSPLIRTEASNCVMFIDIISALQHAII